VLPASISLVDGIVAMHATGPIHGEPFPLGLIACGTNPVALDTALLSVLGINPAQSPLWQAARRAGIRGTEPATLEFPLVSPTELGVRGFMVPETLSPIRFNPFRFVHNSMKRLQLRVLGR
jgi:uncharacterized protein (DUF362 family)